MACEVAVLNPQMELHPVMDGFYHHQAGSWGQPLSPDTSSPSYVHSPVGSIDSPVSDHSPFGVGASSPLTHAPVPSPPMGVGSPPAAHSPMMPQAAAHSPVASGYIKQEQYEELGYDAGSSCSHLAHLLKSTAPELLRHSPICTSMAPMGAPSTREILDGELSFLLCLSRSCYEAYVSLSVVL